MFRTPPPGPQPRWKRPVYLACSTLLGIILSYAVHAILEFALLLDAQRNGTENLLRWTTHFGIGPCALPVWLQYGLLALGIIGGFLTGRVWWRWVYVERKWEKTEEKNMSQQKKGFTIIELLIVIAIIGILSAIGLVALNGSREKARDTQRITDIVQMSRAMVLYYDDNKEYPPQAFLSQPLEIDCIRSDGSFFRVSFPSNGATITVAHGTVWHNGVGLPIIPLYLTASLIPPGGGEGWQDIYCYDTNKNATPSNTSFILFTGLEAGNGAGFFSINSEGKNGSAKPAAACDTQDICAI